MFQIIAYVSVGSGAYIQRRAQDDTEQRSSEDPLVEVITPEVYNDFGAGGSRDPFSGIWSRKLRVKITGRDGFEKLDIRIPVSRLSFYKSWHILFFSLYHIGQP